MTAKRALAWGLLAWAIYVAIRSLLQVWIPFHDWQGYVVQDLVTSLFRLACGLTCLWIARARWTDRALGLGPAAPLPLLAWLSLAVLLSGEMAGAMSQRADWNSPHWIRIAEVAIALVVAFNEEAGFRALFYNGLRELWGRVAAVLLSTLLFTLMHIGYQPPFHLLKVFLIGLTFAILRDKGASLKLLVIVHFLADSIYAATLAGMQEDPGLYRISLVLSAGAALLAWRSRPAFAPGSEGLLFVYASLKPGEPESKALGVDRRCDIVGQGSTQGRLVMRGAYPAMLPSKNEQERVVGTILRLRDGEFLGELDAYEGDEYLRDKALIQMENGKSCEAWIYVAASGQPDD